MIREKVIEVLKRNTGIDNITEDMRFGTDIVMTSISIMKMVYDLEEELKIDNLSVEAMYEIDTVADLIELVESSK